MSLLDKPLRKVSKQLISKFGTAVTVVRRGDATYNVETGTTTESSTNYTIKAVIDDYTAKEITGLVQVGDRRLTIASSALPFEPTTSDQLIFEGITHNIISTNAAYSGDLSAVITLQVRK